MCKKCVLVIDDIKDSEFPQNLKPRNVLYKWSDFTKKYLKQVNSLKNQPKISSSITIIMFTRLEI